MSWRIIDGDCRERLADLESASVQTCVTSPPYHALRDYGHDGQIGHELNAEEYIGQIVGVCRQVRRALTDTGTLWLNIGDRMAPNGSLMGFPWRIALALKADGWILRSEVIWHKRNGLPDGTATDRPDRFHEQIFLLVKQRRYFYNADAIREESDPDQAAHNLRYAKSYAAHDERVAASGVPGNVNNAGIHSRPSQDGKRNKRSVWSVSVARYDTHSATFPPKLIEPCILAGSREGDSVLDPFSGAGTTGLVALRHGRSYVGIELNAEYAEMSRWRLRDDAPLLNTGLEEAA